MTKITLEQYRKAKRITDAYEEFLLSKWNKKADNAEKELNEYFKNNIISGFHIKEVRYDRTNFNSIEIIPKDPYFEEFYDDEKADLKIKCIGKKYGIRIHWVYWVYHK